MKRLCPKTFYSGAITRMYIPPWKRCKKKIQFYHNKGIDILKLGFNLLNLANIFLHKSTSYKICPFAKKIKICVKKLEKT